MSASMVVNTGRLREPIIRDTMVNAPRDIKEKHLGALVSKTTGVPMGSPVMAGVLEKTVPASRKDTAELTMMPKAKVGKTQARTMGQVSYSGPMF